MGAFFNIALAIPTLCLSPPLNLNPFSPMRVFSFLGSLSTVPAPRLGAAASHTFIAAGGVPANNVAKWDGTQWSALGAGVPSGHEAIDLEYCTMCHEVVG